MKTTIILCSLILIVSVFEETAVGGSEADSHTFYGIDEGVNTTGDNDCDTFLGNYTGYSTNEDIGNVFFGCKAARNETGSNTLYIDNSDTAAPLIYGEFDTDIVALNGKVGIGTPLKIPLQNLQGWGGGPWRFCICTAEAELSAFCYRLFSQQKARFCGEWEFTISCLKSQTHREGGTER